MFRKKYNRLIFSLIVGAVLLIVAFIVFNQQKEQRDTELSIRNGVEVEATLYKIPGWTYKDGTKNKYLYVFTVSEDGENKQYANTTRGEYYADYETTGIYIKYAQKGGRVVLTGDDTQQIDGVTYEIAISSEIIYLKNNPVPSLTAAKVLFFVCGLVLLYCLYNMIWIMFYKNIERKGILTYAIFIEASASKSGSNRFMAIRYKYKDLDDNWIEATSPYTFSALTAEKLMLMETFKIRYKGKRSMIAEDTKPLRI